MVRIVVNLDPGVNGLFTESNCVSFGDEITPVIRRCFGLGPRKKVPLRAIVAFETVDSPDFEIEVFYCRKTNRLRVPDFEKRMKAAFRKSMRAHGLPEYSVSIALRPQ